MILMLALWVLGRFTLSWWNNHQLDVVYGMPRTYQTDQVVGHDDSTAHPSHFIAVNLHSKITIIEIPGGNNLHARIYPGPSLFSDNGDGKVDMIVHVGDQKIVYLNDGTQFNRQPEVRAVIRVLAVLLPPRMFTAQVAIVPTGIKVYPATMSHGWITFTNGSIIGQYIPAGFTINGITTDKAVYVPSGNIPTLAINQVIGSSVFVRNLSAFSGGGDTYAVKVVTAHDKQAALTKARDALTHQIVGLHYPCSEDHIADLHKMVISWRCRFVTYTIPSYMRVLRVRLSGKNLLVDVVFTPPPVRIWEK